MAWSLSVAGMLLVTPAAPAQVSADVALSNGVQLSVVTRDQQGAAVALKVSMEPASGQSFFRIFRDENNLAVFAYELTVTRTSDGQQFRAIARPATENFAARHPNADGGKPTPTLSATMESPLLDSGGSFVIPIPTAPELKQTLSDTVQVRLNARGAAPVAAGQERSQEIRFSSLKVSIDNRPASPSGAGAAVAGRFAMFYVPGRGGYFFSLAPVDQPPFLQIGVVDGTHLKFTLENHGYDCTSDAAILTRTERGQLWVYHDPNYKPEGNWTKSEPASAREEFFTAAADSVRWWVR